MINGYIHEYLSQGSLSDNITRVSVFFSFPHFLMNQILAAHNRSSCFFNELKIPFCGINFFATPYYLEMISYRGFNEAFLQWSARKFLGFSKGGNILSMISLKTLIFV